MITDVLGRVQHTAFVKQGTAGGLELDISKLAKGIYWIRVKTSSTTKVFSVLKQ